MDNVEGIPWSISPWRIASIWLMAQMASNPTVPRFAMPFIGLITISKGFSLPSFPNHPLCRSRTQATGSERSRATSAVCPQNTAQPKKADVNFTDSCLAYSRCAVVVGCDANDNATTDAVLCVLHLFSSSYIPITVTPRILMRSYK